MSKTIWLGDHYYTNNQLFFLYGIDSVVFSVTYWYKDLDLFELSDKIGRKLFNKMIFHIMAFEINKLCNFKPDFIELRRHSKYYTAKFEALWRKIFVKVWGQWRFQNNFDYQGPKFILHWDFSKEKQTKPFL